MNGKIIFMSDTENIDMLGSIKFCIKYGYSALAIRILANSINVNDSKGDKFFLKCLEHGNNAKVDIWAYVDLMGGDVRKEAKRVITRIKAYTPNAAFAGLIISIDDSWSKRKVEEADLFISLIRSSFPILKLGFFDKTTGQLSDKMYSAFAQKVSWCMPLVTSFKEFHDTYERYRIRYFGNVSTEIMDKKFIPVVPICNLPSRGFVFKLSHISQIHATANSYYSGIGHFDWNPKGVPCIWDDNCSIEQSLAKLVWTGNAGGGEMEIPEVVPEELSLESLDIRVTVLENLHKIA